MDPIAPQDGNQEQLRKQQQIIDAITASLSTERVILVQSGSYDSPTAKPDIVASGSDRDRIPKEGSGMPPIPPDLVAYRLDRNEAAVTALEGRSQVIEATVNRIEAKLDGLATRTEIAALPTKDSFRNWNLAVIAAVVATFLSMAGLFLASAANQLSAFSTVLSALQAVKPP